MTLIFRVLVDVSAHTGLGVTTDSHETRSRRKGPTRPVRDLSPVNVNDTGDGPLEEGLYRHTAVKGNRCDKHWRITKGGVVRDGRKGRDKKRPRGSW